MEIVLIIVIIGLLFFIKSEINSRFDRIEDKFRELQRKFDQLNTQKDNLSPIVKPTEKVFTPPIPETAKPISKPEETIQPLQPDVPLPPANEPQKTVFNTNRDIIPESQAQPPYIPQKSWWESFKENNPDLEKFIGENIINKIGVLVLVLGISYLVKYAIDKDWINEPARVGIGILSGTIVMGFAHKLRRNFAAFSSVLVAGAIAIFYFTIAIAFHEYHLFSQTAAFIIMVVITGFSAFISLSYNRIELAILSLIGGFAAPFMISTGEGNYMVLFTYIAILDIGILAIAYHKKWNLINIISYLFTVLLYGGWLFKEAGTQHPHYFGALAFGFLFYFIFILINIINNIRTKGTFSTTELAILASNTFIFYAAGMFILSQYHPEFKGLFTTVLGLLNFSYAWFLYKKFGIDKTAVYLLIGLTLTFITLAVPIQFEGNYITLFWAAEGIVLMWLAQKSNISFYRFVSVIVHFLMLISLVMDFRNIYESQMVLDIIVNPAFMTAAFSIIALYAVSWLLKDETQTYSLLSFTFKSENYRKYINVILVILGYFAGLFEVMYQASDYIANDHSAYAFPTLYHLLFGAVFIYLIPKTESFKKIATAIAMLNIILFVFLFSKTAFAEHNDYIATGISSQMAFYLHYISLLLTVYQAVMIYKMSSDTIVFNIFKSRGMTFIAAFIIVYAASTELMLHGLILSGNPVTEAEISAEQQQLTEGFDTNYLKTTLARDKIYFVRNQIIKTGFPILWGALAFAFLITGIRKKWKDLRIIALALLGITILKLFLFDIRNASETGKIVAFILLGVLILIISFVYQKLKILVIDEKPQQENNLNQTTDETQ